MKARSITARPITVRQTLLQVGKQQDGDINLVDAALALSAWAEPPLNLNPYLRHASELADQTRAYLNNEAASATLCAQAARQIISRRYGYGTILDKLEPDQRGDSANLARVMDKRQGGADALCILYDHALAGLGVRVEAIDFPARTLLRIEDDHGQRLVIDPLNGGRTIDARGMRKLHRDHHQNDGDLDPFNLGALSRRDVLIALQDEVKLHYLRMAAPEAAMAALEAALLIAPEKARLWREAGLLHSRLDHIGDAIFALEQFLNLPGDTAHRYTASQLLQQLQNREDKKPS